jgi:hypothetical protein
MSMTKIAIQPATIATPDFFLKVLVVLPETAVLAFHETQRLLYVRDSYADVALANLTQAGISAQVVKSGIMERV